MVTALIIGVIVALLVAATWWIVQPKLNEDVRDLEEPLPLFSSRIEDGSAGARQHPSIEPAEVALLRRGPSAAPRPALPAASSTPPAASRHDGNGSSLPAAARLGGTVGDGSAALTPTAPRDAVVPGVSPQARVRDLGAPLAEAGLPSLPLSASSTPAPLPAGTVQFLPGRLEVLQGRGLAGQELRFIRPDDPAEHPAVTFGRGEGPPYRHVQLRAPTVSRMHARMVLTEGGTWMLENLSTTNPIVLNAVELASGGPPQPLRDGDRIEMGEVVFRYRQR